MNISDVIKNTLSGMASGPKNFTRALNYHSDDYPAIETMFMEHIKSAASSDLVFNLLNQKLSSWDYEATADWISDTQKNTIARRHKIYELLKIDSILQSILDIKLPPNLDYEMPIVIARKHEPWYDLDRQTKRSFYREAYSRYLRENKGWNESQIQNLEESTRLITERLSDPERDEVHPTKGLVVGYVQSGKTANFTGVVARAADAGYRLIIILAGTMNILRAQTQRRIDRELIGKPFITAEDEASYAADLDNFIDHGVLPSDIGEFDWHRLTNIEGDYQRLKQGIQSLEFRKTDKGLPFNHPKNLHTESVRLLVVKKVPAILKKVAADLDAIRTRLADIPTLVIDDESDQASVNTKKPTKKEVEDRTETNSAIVSLLQKLPRAQYVGYTATPFANVFIDPNNEENLFPRDFIISLPRPDNYMGVADFHDLERPDKDSAGPNELMFVRNVIGADDLPKNLPGAIDSFILTGAIKLYRQSVQPSLTKKFRHHTMLVHVSNLTSNHTDIANEVNLCLDKGGYIAGTAWKRLEHLWKTDFAKFCNVGVDTFPTPKTFEEIKPFLGKCWSRLIDGEKPVLIVNGEKNDNPNFESDDIWKIVVGGAKLSRGYTIEGLTISYYRRRAGAADALMQMGRWFGFRDGYRDLVRLFIGREEKTGAKGSIDLFEAFEGVCRDEIAFRSELQKYAYPESGEPILPIQVPPLVPSHLLRPTAGNKMYNAVVKFKNFSEAWKEPTLAPVNDLEIKANQKQLEILLSKATSPIADNLLSITPKGGKAIDFHTKSTILGSADMIKFLRTYKWANGDRSVLINEIEFLEHSDSNIDKWLFLYINGPKGSKDYNIFDLRFSCYRRSRTDSLSERFNVYSESLHRSLARYLCGLDDASANNKATKNLRSSSQGIFIFYPTIDKNNTDSCITPGFTLQFPHNNNKTQIRFGVNSPKNPDRLTIDKTAN